MIDLSVIGNDFFNLSPWPIVKFFFLVALLIYIIFTLILVRQVAVMDKIFHTRFNILIKSISILLFGLSVAVLIVVLRFL